MREIDQIYKNLCKNLIDFGEEVGDTLEFRNVQFNIHDIKENIVGIRNLSASYLFGEWLWYFSGINDVSFISAFGSMWKRLSDDGITSNSAYGYIMKQKFGFDQIEKVIELLKKDPNSRRAVINLNTPNEKVIETKDEPCTIALDFYIRDNKLNCTCMMRSNDIWFGLPYDAAFFMELQKYIADQLGVEYGIYTHFAVSLHAYIKDLDKIRSVVENPKQILIKYDREKFLENKDLISKIIKIVSKTCSSDFVRKLLLVLATGLFDYQEVKIED